MRKYIKLAKNKQNFQRLTGITPEKFFELAKEVGELYEAWNRLVAK